MMKEHKRYLATRYEESPAKKILSFTKETDSLDEARAFIDCSGNIKEWRNGSWVKMQAESYFDL